MWAQSLRRVPGVRNGNPDQYSCLENPMAWWVTVYGIAEESDTTLATKQQQFQAITKYLNRSP